MAAAAAAAVPGAAAAVPAPRAAGGAGCRPAARAPPRARPSAPRPPPRGHRETTATSTREGTRARRRPCPEGGGVVGSPRAGGGGQSGEADAVGAARGRRLPRAGTPGAPAPARAGGAAPTHRALEVGAGRPAEAGPGGWRSRGHGVVLSSGQAGEPAQGHHAADRHEEQGERREVGRQLARLGAPPDRGPDVLVDRGQLVAARGGVGLPPGRVGELGERLLVDGHGDGAALRLDDAGSVP